MTPEEQEQRLRTAIGDAIQDSLGTMMLDDEVLAETVDAVFYAIERLVNAR